METKRDYLQLDDEFNKANGIVSCIGDLLMVAHNNNSSVPVDGSTLEHAGHTCFEQAKQMRLLFSELLELYVADKRK